MVMEIKSNAFDSNSKPFKIILSIKRSAENLNEVFTKIADYWFSQNRQAIFSQRSSVGRFTDLKSETKKSKRRRYGDPYPILVASGKLRDSLTNRLNVNAIFRIRGNVLTLGTEIPYATPHQTGFKHYKSGRKVPARPPISLTAGGLNKFITRMARETSFVFEKRLRKSII